MICLSDARISISIYQHTANGSLWDFSDYWIFIHSLFPYSSYKDDDRWTQADTPYLGLKSWILFLYVHMVFFQDFPRVPEHLSGNIHLL